MPIGLIRGRVPVIVHCMTVSIAVALVLILGVTGYLVDIIVHLVGHFFELVVSHAEVSLVWVEVSVLPAALSLSLIHVGGQVEGCLKSLKNRKDKKIPFLLSIPFH